MKLRKKMLAALAAACLMLCAAGAMGETLTCVVADGQYVNVRNRASRTAATWGILHTGDVIEAQPHEITNGYFKTTYGDRVAYVSVNYFEIPVDATYRVEANGRVRLRKSPMGDAAGFVRPGDTVHVTAWRFAADGSRWGKCTGGQFVSAEFLSPAK